MGEGGRDLPYPALMPNLQFPSTNAFFTGDDTLSFRLNWSSHTHSLTCLFPMNFPSWPYNLLMVNIFSRYFIESKQVALTLIYFPSILFCVQKGARLYQPFVLTVGIICLQLDACSSFIATFLVCTLCLLSCLCIVYLS